MKLKQIVVSIENAPGRLLEVTSALGQAGINLRALSHIGILLFTIATSGGQDALTMSMSVLDF